MRPRNKACTYPEVDKTAYSAVVNKKTSLEQDLQRAAIGLRPAQERQRQDPRPACNERTKSLTAAKLKISEHSLYKLVPRLNSASSHHTPASTGTDTVDDCSSVLILRFV